MFIDHTEKRFSFWLTIGNVCAVVLMSWFIAFILINWLTGCGEQFPTANGSYIAGECIPFHLGLLDK